jgi:hypothetical protein
MARLGLLLCLTVVTSDPKTVGARYQSQHPRDIDGWNEHEIKRRYLRFSSFLFQN